jgi:hypothetical protein
MGEIKRTLIYSIVVITDYLFTQFQSEFDLNSLVDPVEDPGEDTAIMHKTDKWRSCQSSYSM